MDPQRLIYTSALLLRKTDFSETSQVLRLLTQGHGKISAVAKGIKRPNINFDGPMDLFTLYKIGYFRRSSDTLCILTYAEGVTSYRHIASGFTLFSQGCYMLELVDQLSMEGEVIPGLFEFLLDSIRDLNHPWDQDRLMGFELGLLKLVGFPLPPEQQGPRHDLRRRLDHHLKTLLSFRVRSRAFID
jgi:DNA repair protein RecO (recombination protein O)